MAKEKHQAKRVFVVVDEQDGEPEVKLCFLDDQQGNAKETLGTFRNITNDSDFYYVDIKNLNSTNARKKPEYCFKDADDNEIKCVRCEGTADVVLKEEVIFTRDAGRVCETYKKSLEEANER